MKSIRYIIFLFFFTSCLSSGEENKSNSNKTTSTKSHCFDCYFYMFDKYEHDYDMDMVEHWKDSLVGLFKENKIPEEYSIFNKNGGGPLGAQWNSNASIFCIMEIIAENDLGVYLNNNLVKTLKSSDRIPDEEIIFHFSLTSTQWTKALESILEADFQRIYSSEELENLSSVENSPLGVGKIVEIRIMNIEEEQVLCNRILHVVYGE